MAFFELPHSYILILLFLNLIVFDNDLLDISNSNLGVLKRMGVKENKRGKRFGLYRGY